MKTNKLLTFSTIALLLINVVLVYFLWTNKNRHPRKDRGGERGDWVVKELNLDENQKQEHKNMKDAHFAKLKPIFDSITATRKKLYELIKDSTSDDSLVKEYTRIIGEQHSLMSQNTFEHFKKLRNILKPDQQSKLDTIVQKMVMDMGRKGGKSGKNGSKSSQ